MPMQTLFGLLMQTLCFVHANTVRFAQSHASFVFKQSNCVNIIYNLNLGLNFDKNHDWISLGV